MNQQDSHASFYGEMARLNFVPGWARTEPALWPEPAPKFKPAVWRYAEAKAALDEAGEFVPVEKAERRNLIMMNPCQGNPYATSRNLVSAYQMVKSGEKAPSHRHTPAALRLVVDAKPGRGAGTVTPTRAIRPAIGSTFSTCRSCSTRRRCSSSTIRRDSRR